MDEITKILIKIKTVEEKFKKIQENPALYGAEHGLTKEELIIFDKFINSNDEVNIITDEIIKKVST